MLALLVDADLVQMLVNVNLQAAHARRLTAKPQGIQLWQRIAMPPSHCGLDGSEVASPQRMHNLRQLQDATFRTVLSISVYCLSEQLHLQFFLAKKNMLNTEMLHPLNF